MVHRGIRTQNVSGYIFVMKDIDNEMFETSKQASKHSAARKEKKKNEKHYPPDPCQKRTLPDVSPKNPPTLVTETEKKEKKEK